MLSDSKIALGRPRARPVTFSVPRTAPKSDLERCWRPLWAHMGPQSAPESSKSSFSTPRRLSRDSFSPMFQRFLGCNSDALRLLFLSFCLCVCVFARVLFKASIVNLESSNPKSLKPWVAAGGREAIRIILRQMRTQRGQQCFCYHLNCHGKGAEPSLVPCQFHGPPETRSPY